MGPKRIMFLALAGLVAVLAMFIVRGLAVGKDKHAPVAAAAAVTAPPMTYVAVAARDLSVGDRLADTDLTWQPWPSANLIPAYVTNGEVPTLSGNSTLGRAAGGALSAASNMKQKTLGMDGTPGAVFVGAVAKETIHKGEPIISDKVVRAGTSGVMAVRLEPGMRAIAIPLSAESSAGGFVLPGDHVDVVQTRKLDLGRVTSTTVMKNVRVLAIDQNTTPSAKGTSTLGATATLEVSPSQAENMALARAQGDLTLSLRSYADGSGPAVDGTINKARDLLGPTVVKVYRNAAATDVKVAR